MIIDLGSLERAVASLARAVERSSAVPADTELRDAVIQRFGYTYELSWKLLKRRIEADHPSPENVDRMSFKELLREGAERGLVREVGAWIAYRESRNLTSHTYDEDAAVQVHATALTFLDDARALLAELEVRNRD